ncbi:MAG: hypothetical protein J0L73_21630 [Verrucomicrobia bacterium]|nr:hypothetical protein [Verrucomicrobiota bacterium]
MSGIFFSNGDGTADETAVLAGNDPSGGGANLGKEALADDDGDGIPNAQELKLGIAPSQSNTGWDQDGDGFTDIEEALAGSDIFDSGSRCGPAILERTKTYGYDASTATTTDPFTHEETISQYFGGDAYNDYGEEFIDIQQTGDGNLDLDGLATSVRSAFESGAFDGPNPPVYPKILSWNDVPRPAYSRTLTNNIYGPSYVAKVSAGVAKEFSITGATIPTSPAIPWTRVFVVTKYTGVALDIAFESMLTDGAPVGIVVFSQDDAGNQIITYEGSEADSIKIVTGGDGKKSVRLMPLREEGKIISFRLAPVEIMQPTIDAEGKAGDLAFVNSLRMCRWGSERDKDYCNVNRGEFPKNDPDHFVVRLPLGHREGTASIQVNVSTAGASDSVYNDQPHEIEFTEEGSSGVFVSKPMALVVDPDDDGLSVGGTSENGLNDPTFISKPGSKVVLTCDEIGSSPIEIPVKYYSHRVRTKQIYAGDIIGMDAAQSQLENIARCPQIYAQVHMRIDEEHAIETISSVDTDLQKIYADHQLTEAELRVLISKIDAFELPLNVMKIVWIPREVSFVDDDPTVIHFGRNMRPKRADIAFLFLAKLASSPLMAHAKSMTMAHEMGHALREAGHFEYKLSTLRLPKYHVMAEGGGNPISDGAPDTSGKHWYVKETEALKIFPAEPVNP